MSKCTCDLVFHWITEHLKPSAYVKIDACVSLDIVYYTKFLKCMSHGSVTNYRTGSRYITSYTVLRNLQLQHYIGFTSFNVALSHLYKFYCNAFTPLQALI